MKALMMMDLYLIFQFVKGRCHGNHAFFACSPDGSTVLVRYYSLGSDTATPNGYTLGFAMHF